jgi:hypothetical protein
MGDMINFYTFKWGNKYGPEYVIRLRNSICKFYNGPFYFTCITDDPVRGVMCEDIREYKLFGESVFTAEKMELMAKKTEGTNVLLDLDMLIHNDITDIFEPCKKPRFVYTHWTPDWHWEKLVPKKTACFINSSFVMWEGDNAKFIYDHYMSSRGHHSGEYNSFDKYMFYEHYLPATGMVFDSRECPFEFWPGMIFYNYNEQGETQYQLLDNRKVCLFNTSHLIKMDRRYYELDNTPSEHTEIWESYDRI